MRALTPEQLIQAFEHYIQTPIEQRKISAEQVAWFYDPENVMLLLYFCFTAPDEIVETWQDDITPWLETATAELATTVYKMPKDAKPQIEYAIAEILRHIQQEGTPFSAWLLPALSALKRHHFSLSVDLAELLADETSTVTPLHAPESLDFIELLDGVELHSGYDFVDFFEQGLSLLPENAYADLFAQVGQYSWGIDALLLLTQYFEKSVALACATQLNQCTYKEWQQLTLPHLLSLCARFNRHPEISAYFNTWHKHSIQAWQVNTDSPELIINELYATHVDGSDCSSLLLSTSLMGDECHLSMMFDFKTGIRESLILGTPEQPLAHFVDQLSQEIEFQAVDPRWLAQVLPWMLAVQQQRNTPLDIASLFWLSQLPATWTQPQPFELHDWCQSLHYTHDVARQERNRKTHLFPSAIALSWLAPLDKVEQATQAKDLLKGYYYANKSLFQQRLAYGAAVDHFSKISTFKHSLMGLDMAIALDDPAIHRKKFPLFEDLSEISFEEYQQYRFTQDIAPQGLVLKVQLEGARPGIWRRVQINNQMTLNDFHDALQIAMGWEDSHLYLFLNQGKPIDEEEYEDIQLGHLLQHTGNNLIYIYDFGDNWTHDITVEKIMTKPPRVPTVTAGNGFCPAEDCGGIWQWNDILKMLKRTNLDDDELEHLEWVGLTPEEPAPKFDKQQANQTLTQRFELK